MPESSQDSQFMADSWLNVPSSVLNDVIQELESMMEIKRHSTVANVEYSNVRSFNFMYHRCSHH